MRARCCKIEPWTRSTLPHGHQRIRSNSCSYNNYSTRVRKTGTGGPARNISAIGDPERDIYTFADAGKRLNAAGIEAGEFDDFSTPRGKALGREKYSTGFYTIDRYPSAARPFYTMPDAANFEVGTLYNFFMSGRNESTTTTR